ncbi:hypothetical protein [Thiomicrorhabdus lithotrophica]|uniref:DUF302 domain-containing protein n=1 Tax=Thiomicrorhabdus lithotrophica TaxID=2949997 RepID=A0ABY8CBI8_9GAMM|nr:hypothetical protein [Thiomicrorhabdus lithotrophica]WEJ62847.1 hypothetical protein NR989_00975 [Thiomicrorhabdus lithotrophica]
MKALLISIMMVFAVSVQAQTMAKQSFEDQWEKPVELNEQTKWLVITQSKDAGKIVKESFETLGLNDLAQINMLYLADISGMPGFITSMFAIPKMRDYGFQIGLINEDGQLAALELTSLDSEKVSVVSLNNLEVMDTQLFEDDVAFKAFLQSNVLGKLAK